MPLQRKQQQHLRRTTYRANFRAPVCGRVCVGSVISIQLLCARVGRSPCLSAPIPHRARHGHLVLPRPRRTLCRALRRRAGGHPMGRGPYM